MAPLTLSVNFAADTISGCIGCGGVIEVAGFAVSPNGEYVDFSGSIESRLRLRSANINSDGTFTGGSMTFEVDNLPNGFSIVSTSGNWGGKFSTKQDADGAPRLVAGTNSAFIRYSDGTEGELVGTFVASKQ